MSPTLLKPQSIREALGMLREGPVTPLAGCTDLFVGGLGPETRYLDLWGLDELRGIRMRRETLALGALTTFSELIRSKVVRRRLPMLAAAAADIGGPQIRNRGTIGGNIANGSPAGDTLPVFAAAEAVVVLESADGTRRVPFNAYYTGYRRSVRRPDELIAAVEVPAVEGRQWFWKVGTRAAQAISKVVMAAVRADACRVALGSVAPTVIRCPKTEAALEYSIDHGIRALRAEIQPIDDIRSTAEYRRRVACNLLGRFWRETS